MKEIMKDKNLLTEITRIKEMMGISLITESISPKAVKTLLVKLLTDATTDGAKKLISSALTKVANKNFNTADLKILFNKLKLTSNPAIKSAIVKFENKIVNKASESKYTKEIEQRLNDGASELDIERNILADWKSTYGDYIKGTDMEQRFVNKLKNRVTKVKKDLVAPRTDTSTTTNTTRTDTTTPRTEPIPAANIEKTWEQVTDSITPETMAKLSKELGTRWRIMLERLFDTVTIPFKSAIRLQNEIIEDFGKWSKAGANEKPIIKNKIIAKLKSLQNSQQNILDATNIWINTRVKPLALEKDIRGNFKNPEINILYTALEDKQGWGKLKLLESIFNSMGIAIKDILTGNKNLFFAYTKILGKTVTTPINLGIRLRNAVLGKNIPLINQLTPEQKKAFLNWFGTTNPEGFKGLKLAFTSGSGGVSNFIGGLTYIGVQALYRYFVASTIFGIYRAIGALGIRGVDAGTNFIGDKTETEWIKTDMFDTKIADIIFGTKSFRELNQKFKENTEESKWEYRKAIYDWFMKQSEPFRTWIGFWPAGKVLGWIEDAVISMQNDTIDQRIDELFQDVVEAEREVERATGQTIDEVIDGTETVVNDIDDTEQGFKNWCQRTGREFTGYDEGIGTTVEDGKEKYWYFDTDENTFKENKPE
jgi:hypothetical protein